MPGLTCELQTKASPGLGWSPRLSICFPFLQLLIEENTASKDKCAIIQSKVSFQIFLQSLGDYKSIHETRCPRGHINKATVVLHVLFRGQLIFLRLLGTRNKICPR